MKKVFFDFFSFPPFQVWNIYNIYMHATLCIIHTVPHIFIYPSKKRKNDHHIPSDVGEPLYYHTIVPEPFLINNVRFIYSVTRRYYIILYYFQSSRFYFIFPILYIFFICTRIYLLSRHRYYNTVYFIFF